MATRQHPTGHGASILGAEDPDRADVGNRKNRSRIPVYRVFHTIDNGEPAVWAVHVGHRSTVYDTQPLQVLRTTADSTTA
ncbi:hypothetical protein GCM10015535_16840 [Streptomyces gelaticus]|uniref:Uncharacterized protein n=1 Tax=Streptomyces gelaticus TaxID=285446 RepID=A0ABQ2VY40_9ACTN|nr:hypothetical protein GCM10015535_16840 [Streptomyces gelaticus]